MRQQKCNSIASGVGYFSNGVKLLLHPELRIYILVPLLVNIVLFSALTYTLYGYFRFLTGSLELDIPSWLSWAGFALDFAMSLLGFILAVLFIIFYAYSFNIITNVLAAPFYGKLAERAESLITGEEIPSEPIPLMVIRTFKREIHKLLYFFFRGIFFILIILMLGTIPLINLIAPIVGLAWSIWCMSIQYIDYPADNNQIPFIELRNRLWAKKYSSSGLGAMVMLASVTPLINIIAMPAAVIAGTLFWVHELKDNATHRPEDPG